MAKILITDDSDTIREVMKGILAKTDHVVVGEAENGLEAVEKFKELRPDITTLDIAMPVMDGMEALEKIMEIDPNAHIIMVSSASSSGNIPKSILFGACEFLEKPIDEICFLNIIAKIENYITA